MIVYHSRLIYFPSDGNIQSHRRGEAPRKTKHTEDTDHDEESQNLPCQHSGAATERELTGIELMFKQDMSINCDYLGKLCRAAEDKRYTLRNNAETLQLKDILFQRTRAEMDAYHDMSHKPESWTA